MIIVHVVNYSTSHPWLARLIFQLETISSEQHICAIESKEFANSYPRGIFGYYSKSEFRIVRIIDNLKYIRALKQKLADRQILLICHGYWPSFLGYLVRKIVKIDYIIFHHHQPRFLADVLKTNFAKKLLLLKINELSLYNALKIVAMSDEVIDYLRKCSISSGDLIYVPHGVNFDTEPYKVQMQSLPSRISNSILMIGRLSPEKQVHLALQSVVLLRNRIPNLKLVVIGIGPDEKELINYAKEIQVDDIVSFVGWQESVYEWLDKSQLFLHLAKTESYGQVLIEAFGSGIQVLSTKVGVVPELVRLDSVGIQVLPEENLNPVILGDAIEESLRAENKAIRRWHLIQHHNEVRAHKEFCLALEKLMRGLNEA